MEHLGQKQNDLNTARGMLGAAGTQTAALAFGGTEPPVSNKTEKYNGASWTEVNELLTARNELAGAGTQTAALAIGGYHGNTPPPTGYENKTEKFDGTNWTETGDLNTARSDMGGAGSQYSSNSIWWKSLST